MKYYIERPCNNKYLGLVNTIKNGRGPWVRTLNNVPKISLKVARSLYKYHKYNELEPDISIKIFALGV